MIQLYKSRVHPHLEYAIQAWAPYLQKDINRLESVQRRATTYASSLQTSHMKQDSLITNFSH